MKTTVLAAIILGPIAPIFGTELAITSPDHARTFAYGEMIGHQLDNDLTSGVLTARITFSNLRYVSDTERRSDESFDFRFPGVRLDKTNRFLSARARHGEQVRIAQIHGGPSGGSIELVAGAKIYLLKESGRVTAVLTATERPRPGLRWIQMDDNWSLQNLLVGVFRPPRG